MKNVIGACKKENTKLVFFDNIYIYDPNHLSHMTEDTPFNPISKKGEVRTEIVTMLLNEMGAGNLRATIARSADFYGFSPNTSVLEIMVFKNFAQEKKTNWFCSLDFRHSFTFTSDAAKATAILGNSEKAFNETWHLPTAKNPLTGREWTEIIAKEMNQEPHVQLVGRGIARIMGILNKDMKELSEMLYQYDREYVFDSTKFEQTFQFTPTGYSEGVKHVARGYLESKQS
jgi:nucleoside-diphosphate-sugar epimerase